MADLQSAGIGKGTPGPGRRKGLANKATTDARKAIALFVDSNAHRLTEWLNRVADGDDDNKPNPAKAFELFQSVVEYHIPKLARTETDLNVKGELRIVASSADESI